MTDSFLSDIMQGSATAAVTMFLHIHYTGIIVPSLSEVTQKIRELRNGQTGWLRDLCDDLICDLDITSHNTVIAIQNLEFDISDLELHIIRKDSKILELETELGLIKVLNSVLKAQIEAKS